MDELEKILDFSRDYSSIINDLSDKKINVPSWNELRKLYNPDEHSIVEDTTRRKDKVIDGLTQKAARLYFGLEKLVTKRLTEFEFALPPIREYKNLEDNQTRKEIAQAIEKIFKKARINAHNIERGLAYNASCEIFTLWYTVPKENTFYGFKSKYKLKCKTYSAKDGVSFYPYFDATDDLLAMSFKYSKVVGENTIEYFITYTANKKYEWSRKEGDKDWKLETEPIDIIINKIPGIYKYTEECFYKDIERLREDIEYKISENSDVISYNASPILKVQGNLIGEPTKGESRKIYQLENGGDIDYVSWSQSQEAVNNQVTKDLDLAFMQTQMPDISYKNMVGLGNIGFDARQTIFMDAYLKVRDETGDWLEFFDREVNVVKSFLALMNPAWKSEIDNVIVETTMQPYNIKSQSESIKTMMEANGGKPLLSQKESIQASGVSTNAEETIKLLNEEAEQEIKMQSQKVNNIFV